jgi:hypothetical protein
MWKVGDGGDVWIMNNDDGHMVGNDSNNNSWNGGELSYPYAAQIVR